MNSISIPKSNWLQAFRIVEQLVMRSKDGNVYTVEVGECLISEGAKQFGGKVQKESSDGPAVQFCMGASVQEIVDQAVQLIENKAFEANGRVDVKPEYRASA